MHNYGKAYSYCDDLPTRPCIEIGRLLVTGASGYVGGRLIPELLSRGYSVRAMVRGDPSSYKDRWPRAEVVGGDALDRASLRSALEGVHTAYYLIHSLLLGPDEFDEADHVAARNFGDIAHEQGVKRIIYLGGLGDCRSSKSRHLQCRLEVEDELQASGVSLTTLRAAIIIGSGSASYEIIRNLVRRLRIIPLPPWAKNRCQPIGIRDVVKYLVGVLEVPDTRGQSFDIGGPDLLTYESMLRTFAEIIGKNVLFRPVPVRNIKAFAYFASLLTPVPSQITSCLMEGLLDEVVCNSNDIRKYVHFPSLGYRESIVRALTREEQDSVYTRWSDAFPPAHELAMRLNEIDGSPCFTASYSVESTASSPALFRSVCRVGGKTGWFNSSLLWRVRGGFDRILFGVGSDRGRRSQTELLINDVIDFWRVEDIVADRRVLLRAEMKLPGKAWLEFTIENTKGMRRLRVTAYFVTHSWFGRLYWFFFHPFHHFIFQDLVNQIERRSRELTGNTSQ